MTDHGADISISSFLFFKQDADQLKQVLKNDTVVRAETSWKLPHTNPRVEYDLWTPAKESASATVKKSFQELVLLYWSWERSLGLCAISRRVASLH